MALHQRQTIREAVVAQLVNKTDAAERVFATRQVPWQRTELPGISVYALEEEVDAGASLLPPFGSGEARILSRNLQLAVVAIVSLTEKVDDALDAIALEIETAIDAAPSFGVAAVKDSVLAATEIEIVEEATRPVGVVRLTYNVEYHTQ